MIRTLPRLLTLTRPFSSRTRRPILSLPPSTSHDIETQNPTITIEINSTTETYDKFFLRDLCPCPKCVDPSTQQRLITTGAFKDLLVGRIKVKQQRVLDI